MNQKPDTLPQATCSVMEGTLPGTCASMVFPYIPMQEYNSKHYDSNEALRSGTLFPGLNLPFHAEMKSRFPSEPAELIELMALDFAIDEMALYLDTHPNDDEALSLFHSYIRLSQQGRTKFEALYGPLDKKYISKDGKYTWVNDPWPWEVRETREVRE